MSMDLLKVKPLKDAIEICKDTMEGLNFKREIDLNIEDALGYFLAEDIVAKEDLPTFRRSTMDGFAICSKSSLGASEGIPTILNFAEVIPMGREPKIAISENQASQIFTGGMLPEGADGVVPIEYAEYVGEKLIAIYKPVNPLQYVIDIGDDCKKGDAFYKKGKRITPEVIAMCANLGYRKIKVYEKLKVRIVSTGDEILPPDAKIPFGKIRDVNTYSIHGLCEKAGLSVVDTVHVKDVKEDIARELAACDVDIVIISGSSSKGNKDFVPTVVEENFKPGLLIHGIAIKPGKPTSFSSDGKKIVLGLPGHSVSAYTIFRAFFERALNKFYGEEESFSFPATLTRNTPSAPGMTKVQYVRFKREEGKLFAEPVFAASGNISLLMKAEGFFVIGEDEEGKEKGETLWCELL